MSHESISGESVEKTGAMAARVGTLEKAIEKARDENKQFMASFSSSQKSGLKDIGKKLEKSDAEVDKEAKALEQSVQTSKAESEGLSQSAASLEKALDRFEEEQQALGRDMGILTGAEGQELSFQLPKATTNIEVMGQTVSIATVGGVSRTSAENGKNVFRVKLTADLTDVQHNVTGILRATLTRTARCGERLAIADATLMPLELGASEVVARLHFERWVCPSGRDAMEVADGDGTIKVKLTPTVDAKTGLGFSSEISRVEADRMLRDMLRSGELGETMREGIAAALLDIMKRGADLKSALPAVAQEKAMLEKAEFEEAGAGLLNLVVEGRMEITDEQVAQFKAEMQQRLAAQGATQ
jgi:hypothetical protein